MSTLLREPKYLRVLTPLTNQGKSPKQDEFGRAVYKESYARFSKATIRAFESLNKYRPTYQKLIVETVYNPNFVPSRKQILAKAKANPRPSNERAMPGMTPDIASIEKQLREKWEAEQAAKTKPAAEKRVDKQKKVDDLIESNLKLHSDENSPV